MSAQPPAGEPLPGSAGGAGLPAAHSLGGARIPASDGLGRIVFALLVVGCFAALLITQRLKHTPTLVQEPKLTPVFAPMSSGKGSEEHIAFKLASADDVTVAIESTGGEDVATLVRELPVPRYKIVSLRWSGRKGTATHYTILRRADGYTTLLPVTRGPIAPGGEYRVRLTLRKQDRSLYLPKSFTLVKP